MYAGSITINEIGYICEKAGYIKMKVGSIPTWLNKKEGFEYKNKQINTFTVNVGERVFGEPPSEDQKQVLQSIQLLQRDSQKKEGECNAQKQEETPKQTENKEIPKELVKTNNIDGLLPDFLTSALLSKWAKMTTTDRILLFQKTPSDKIKQVSITKTKIAPYVEGNFMFREANAAFLFDWNFSNITISVCPTGVGVAGTLNAWFSEYQKYISRPATGYQELNSGNDVELAKKGATTDAIKKGLSLFGFNSDVYGGELV